MSVLIVYLFSTGSKELSGSVGLHDDRVSLLVIFLENIICRLDGVLGKNVDPIGKAQGVLHRRDRAGTTTRTQLIRAKKKYNTSSVSKSQCTKNLEFLSVFLLGSIPYDKL